MNDPVIAIRAIHFAATAMTSGVIAFLTLVAGPAYRSTGENLSASGFRRCIVRIAAAGLAVMVASGAAWVVLEAAKMSGRPLAAVTDEDILWTVLTRTTFGVAASIRLGLAVLLAACLAFLGSRRWAAWAAPVLAAALVGALAWTGHAAATEQLAGYIHSVADVLHLVAAGTWFGSLIALTILLATARRRAGRTWHDIARTATLRFSTLGIVSVATLLGSGIVNTWVLAGTLPSLLGTGYGRLLLVKIVLFGAMVSIAAVNRLRLTPRLSCPLPGESHADVSLRLIRNSLIEVGLGLIIFVIVGALGTLQPGVHTRPEWPLSFRVSWEVLNDPVLGRQVLIAMAAAALGVAFAIWGVFWRKLRLPMIFGGAIIVAYFGRGLGPAFTPAYPTSFYLSPTGYSASSIAQGRQLFARHCSGCHGLTGRGDGLAAINAKRKPADLASGHIYAHPAGDQFWWIARGISDAMPGFAEVLDDDAKWNLIDFISANVDGVRLSAYAGVVGRTGYPTPSFLVRCPDGSTVAAEELRGRVVHLVVPGNDSVEQLETLAERARTANVTTILVAQGVSTRPGSGICVADDADLAQVLAVYRGKDEIEGTELLIDQAGFLRVLWHPGVRQPRWPDLPSFRKEAESVRRMPAVPRSAFHLHR